MKKTLILLLTAIVVLCVCVACKNEVPVSSSNEPNYEVLHLTSEIIGSYTTFQDLGSYTQEFSYNNLNIMFYNGHQLFLDTACTQAVTGNFELEVRDYYYRNN